MPRSCAHSVAIMRSSPELYEHYFDGGSSKWQSYLERMLASATWADSFVIQAVASTLHKEIIVYSSGAPPCSFLPFDGLAEGPLISVAHNGVNHFDGLLPRMDLVQTMPHACPANPSLPPPVLLPNELVRPLRNRAKGYRCIGQLRIGSLNCTSLQAHFAELAPWPFDVLLVQETRVNASAQCRLSRDLRGNGWGVIWGAPTVGQVCRADGTTHATTAQGGVAILFRNHLCARAMAPTQDQSDMLTLYNQGRFVHCVIPIERHCRVIHVMCLYGFSGSSSMSRVATHYARNEAALRGCFAYAKGFGEVPFVLGMDFNDRLDHSIVLPQALSSRAWFDAVAAVAPQALGNTYAAKGWGHDEQGTSCIDFLLVNSVALTSLLAADTCKQLYIGQHRAVAAQLNVEAYRVMEMCLVRPEPFKVPPLPEEEEPRQQCQDMENALASSLLAEMQRPLTWQSLNKAASLFLAKRAGCSPCPPAQRKGSAPRFVCRPRLAPVSFCKGAR